MYSLTVRDHIMIAHSLRGQVFGLAQGVHGATYVVDVTFFRESLDADGLVIDIGRAGEELKMILGDLNYRNLDDDPAFAEQNTTTEFLAREIFERVAAKARDGGLGSKAQGINEIAVTLHESHLAWGGYKGAV